MIDWDCTLNKLSDRPFQHPVMTSLSMVADPVVTVSNAVEDLSTVD